MFYWNNTASGIKHDVLVTEPAADGLAVRPGNVVEMRVEPHGALITRVRAAGLAAGGCCYAEVGVGFAVEALGALSMVGPRGSASLYCPGLEREGWVRPRTYWHKPPGPAQPAPTDFVPPRPVDRAAAPEPPPAPADQGLARVTITLSRASGLFLKNLPVHVDDEWAASLEGGQCTVVLLAEGAHRVVAGREGTPLPGFFYARKALDVEARAGQALVLEYLVDDKVLHELSLDSLLTRDAWTERAYTFRQRPATPDDNCALRRPARLVGRPASPGGVK